MSAQEDSRRRGFAGLGQQVAALALGLLLGVGGAVALALVTLAGPAESPPSAGVMPPHAAPRQADEVDLIGDAPCYEPRALPADDLFGAVTTVPSWTPHDELASTATLQNAWYCGGSVVLMRFDSGVDVSLEPGWSTEQDDAASWEAMRAQEDYGVVGNVQGEPAFIEPADDTHPYGEVLFVKQGTLVRVDGNGDLSPDELTRIASTVG